MLVVLYNVALVCIATVVGVKIFDTLLAMRSEYIYSEDYMTTDEGTIPHVFQVCICCQKRFDLTERARREENMPRQQRSAHGYCNGCQPTKELAHDS